MDSQRYEHQFTVDLSTAKPIPGGFDGCEVQVTIDPRVAGEGDPIKLPIWITRRAFETVRDRASRQEGAHFWQCEWEKGVRIVLKREHLDDGIEAGCTIRLFPGEWKSLGRYWSTAH